MVNSGLLSTFDENEAGEPSGLSGASNTSIATAVNCSSSARAGSSSPQGPTIVSPADSDSSDSQDHDMGSSSSIPPTLTEADAYDLSHFFVVDSFNIHRLVIAGVTCASKFFSDVFYTNSRYAKVKPQTEIASQG